MRRKPPFVDGDNQSVARPAARLDAHWKSMKASRKYQIAEELMAQVDIVELDSTEKIEKYADKRARELLNVSREAAFGMLDRGELKGTTAELEFRNYQRHLKPPTPQE